MQDVLELDAVDNLQLYTFVRHLHVFPLCVLRGDVDAAVAAVRDLITAAWHSTIADTFPVLTGALRPDAATLREQLRVHDIDPSKVAERAPVHFHDRRASSAETPIRLNRRRVQLCADWGGDTTMLDLSAPVIAHLLTTMRITLCDWEEEPGEVSAALVLATGVNHRVGDAASTARLLHHFSARCRARFAEAGLHDRIAVGLTPSGTLGPRSQHYLQPPVFTRHAAVACPAWADPDAPAMGNDALAGNLGLDQGGDPAAAQPAALPTNALITIRFDDARLDAFRARQVNNSSSCSRLPISRNDIVVAATLQLVSRGKIAAGACPDERATALVVVDYRGPRMMSSSGHDSAHEAMFAAPANYFGNALVLAKVDAGTLRDAAETPLADLVGLVHREVRLVANNPAEIGKRIRAAIKDSAFGVEMAPGLLALSSWVNGDMYAMDLGWGRPLVATGVQHPLVPGLSFLGPSPPDACAGGGIDVPVTVSAAVAEKLAGSHGNNDVACVVGVSARD